MNVLCLLSIHKWLGAHVHWPKPECRCETQCVRCGAIPSGTVPGWLYWGIVIAAWFAILKWL